MKFLKNILYIFDRKYDFIIVFEEKIDHTFCYEYFWWKTVFEEM